MHIFIGLANPTYLMNSIDMETPEPLRNGNYNWTQLLCTQLIEMWVCSTFYEWTLWTNCSVNHTFAGKKANYARFTFQMCVSIDPKTHKTAMDATGGRANIKWNWKSSWKWKNSQKCMYDGKKVLNNVAVMRQQKISLAWHGLARPHCFVVIFAVGPGILASEEKHSASGNIP